MHSLWHSPRLIRQWISGKPWEEVKHLEIATSRRKIPIHFLTLFMHVLFTHFLLLILMK
nr:MAG TPA: hypothetical protein [Caudoviricetes sp.]